MATKIVKISKDKAGDMLSILRAWSDMDTTSDYYGNCVACGRDPSRHADTCPMVATRELLAEIAGDVGYFDDTAVVIE